MKLTQKRIEIISSLKNTDHNTPRALHDDLIHLIDDTPISKINIHEVKNTNELIKTLEIINQEIPIYGAPIIHIEAHGSYDGLELVDDNNKAENIDWKVLCHILSKINLASKGQLALISASCFGFYALTPITINRISPFGVLIGPQSTILDGELLKDNLIFYKKLLETKNFKTSYNKIKGRMRIYLAEEFFTKLICDYFRKQCMGKGKSERVERLISEALWTNGFKYNSRALKAYRKHAKEFLKPNAEVFNRYANTFLGRKSNYGITFQDVMNNLRNSNK